MNRYQKIKLKLISGPSPNWIPKTKKLINKDGQFFRMRRGKLVEVPIEWIGQVPNNNTMAKRQPIKRRTRKNKNRST
jgi:hypothetical protein